MTCAYKCKLCGAFWMREEEEPIVSVPIYNPHRSNCHQCGREMKGSLIDSSTHSNLDDQAI